MDDTLTQQPQKLEPSYLVKGKLYTESQMRESGWNDEQLQQVPRYHNLKGKNYSEEEMRKSGWNDESLLKLYNQNKVDRGYEPIKTDKKIKLNNEEEETPSFGKLTDEFHTIDVDGANINIKRDGDKIFAKHPTATQWKEIDEWKKTNPEFWSNAEQKFNTDHPSEAEASKQKRFSDYEDARKTIVDQYRQEHKKWMAEETDPYSQPPAKLLEAERALEKFDEKYREAKSFKTHSGQVKKDYTPFLKKGVTPDLINTSAAAFKQNKELIAQEYLSDTQRKKFNNKDKIADLNKQIEEETAKPTPEGGAEAKNASLQKLKEKRDKIKEETNNLYRISNFERKAEIAKLNSQLENEDDPEKREAILDEIKMQESLNTAFFKSNGDATKYQKEATGLMLDDNAQDIVSLTDVIPENATPEEALNIYFQALLKEQEYLQEKLQDNNYAKQIFNQIGDLFFPREDVERLFGNDGIVQKVKAIAPIVALNELPDRLADQEGKALTGNWFDKVKNNIGKTLGITGKEAAKIFLPYGGASDSFITNEDIASQISDVVDKTGITNAVNLAPKEAVNDRSTYDRWTAGWIGERTGPTMAIIVPMALGSAVYTKASRFVAPLRQLNRISRTGKILQGAKTATKVSKLGKLSQKVGLNLTRGSANAIKTGLQYETGGLLFHGNETVSDESDFLSGFLGGIGEGAVMTIPKMFGNIFGKKLKPFMQAAQKFSKAVSKPIGGGFGETGEEFIQTTYQLFRDTETREEFDKQWLHQFGDSTERFDFFAHTFAMGMAFRGSAQFGEMMAKESGKAYFTLSGKEKKQADQFAQAYIADQHKNERKEFQGYTAEFDDENLSILHEDAKAWVEEAEKSKDKEEIKAAKEALNGYEDELSRRRISSEHSRVKAQIESARQSKEILENNKKVSDKKSPKENKRAKFIEEVLAKTELKLVQLNNVLDGLRVKKAKATSKVIPNEIKIMQSKIDNLNQNDLHYEKNKADLLNEINKLSFRKNKEDKIVENYERKEKAKKQVDATLKELTNLATTKEANQIEIDKLEELDTPPKDQIEKLKQENEAIEKNITDLKKQTQSQAYDNQTGRPLFVPISNNKERNKKAVEEAGYEFLSDKPFSAVNDSKGGKSSSQVAETLQDVKVGDVLDISYKKRSEFTDDEKNIRNVNNQKYDHFMQIMKGGRSAGGIGYKSQADRAIKKAIELGLTPKIVVTAKNKHSISYEVIIPEGQKIKKESGTKQAVDNFDARFSAKVDKEVPFNHKQKQQHDGSEKGQLGFAPKGSTSIPVSKNNTNTELDAMQEKMLAEFNTILMEMIQDMGKHIPFVRKMIQDGYFFGTLIHKGYAGFHVFAPWKAILINPAAVEGMTNEGIAWDFMNTIAHELTHYRNPGHDTQFILALARLQRSMKELGYFDKYLDRFTELSKTYRKQINSLRNEHQKQSTKNIEPSIGEQTVPAGASGSNGGASETVQGRRIRAGNYERLEGTDERIENDNRLPHSDQGLADPVEVSFLERKSDEDQIKKDVQYIRDNWDDLIIELGDLVRELFEKDSDFYGTEADVISHVKQAIYGSSEYGDAVKRTRIIDLERASILKQAGLIQKKGGLAEVYDYEAEETVGQSGQQKFMVLRSSFKNLFNKMRAEGFVDPEKTIYNLAQRNDFKNAFTNQRELTAYLNKLSGTMPILAGLLSDFTIMSFEDLLSLKNFYANTKLYKNIVTNKRANAVIDFNKNQEQKAVEYTKLIKETLKNLTYEQDTNPNSALNKIFAEYYQGANSREATINRDNSGEQKGILLHELNTEFLERVTGIKAEIWDGYLKSKIIEPGYYKTVMEGNKVRPKIIQYMSGGDYAPVGKPNSVSKMIAYLVNKQGRSPQSVLVKLLNTSVSEESLSLYFDNVKRSKELAIEQNSHLLISLNKMAKLFKSAFYKNNPIVKYYAEQNKKPNMYKLNGMFGDNGTSESGNITDNDMIIHMLNNFKNGDGTYFQWLGPFGGKDQLYFLEVEKVKNPKQEYKKLKESLTAEESKLLVDLDNAEIYAEQKKMLEDVIIPMTNFFKLIGDKREAFIEDFLYNFAINKHAADMIIHGKSSQYFDVIEMVKRGGSTNSPGMAGDTNLEGGHGKTQKHIIANDLIIDGREVFDGVQFATQDYMNKFALSIGSVFSRVKKFGFMNTAKAIYSEVNENGVRALTKSNIVVIDNLAIAFPESSYGKIYNYMKEHGVDTLSFKSGTKKAEVGLTNLFNGTNFNKKANPIISERNNENFLSQQDLRYTTTPQQKKQPIQATTNFMQFRNSDKIAELWNRIQTMVGLEVAADLEKTGLLGADLVLLKSINPDQRKSLYEYVKRGGKETNPYFDKIIQIMRSSFINKKVLEKGVNRAAYQEIPVADIDLKTIRKTEDGKHVLLPEVNLNVDGSYRYMDSFDNLETAIRIIESQPHLYYDLIGKDGKAKQWELIQENGKVYIPGEPVLITRVPADAPHSHSYARLKHRIPGAGNVIMTDWKTQQVGGADNDGDIRFVEFPFKTKDGGLVGEERKTTEEIEEEKLLNAVFGENEKSGKTERLKLINDAFFLILEDYQDPQNYDNITTAIDTNAYNESIVNVVKKNIHYTQNSLGDSLALRKLNVTSNVIIGIAADFSTTYNFIRKHDLFIKRQEFNSYEEAVKVYPKNEIFKVGDKYVGTKQFTVPKYNLETGTKSGVSKVSGFVEDKYGIVSNHLSNLLNIALDNDKDPKAEFMGFTEQTASMYMLFVVTDVEIDKLPKAEQNDRVMQRIKEASAFFNTPMAREYIQLQRNKQSVAKADALTEKEIMEKLKEKYDYSDYIALKQLSDLARNVGDINKYIDSTREVARTFAESVTRQYVEESVEKNNLSFIDTTGFFDYKKSGKISPYIKSIQLTKGLASNHVHSKAMVKGINLKKIINSIVNVKKFRLNQPQIDLLINKANTAITLMALGNDTHLSSVKLKLESFINNNPENDFIKNLVINDQGRISVHENIQSTKISESELDVAKKGFSELPEETQYLFIIYSLSYHGPNFSNSRGNYANMFDESSLIKLGNTVDEYVKQNFDKEIDDEIIEQIVESIKDGTPILDPEENYSHSPTDPYIDIYARRNIAYQYITDFKKTGSDKKTFEHISSRLQKRGSQKEYRIFMNLVRKYKEAGYDKTLSEYMNRLYSNQRPPQLKRSDALLYPNDFGLYTLHSGGAEGADQAWHTIGIEFGLQKGRHYSSFDNIASDELKRRNIFGEKLTENQLQEGHAKALRANTKLGRIVKGIDTPFGKMISRNWFQVKNADAVFAIGKIYKPGETIVSKGKKYSVRSVTQTVGGGTGWAVQMGIDEKKPVHVYDQTKKQWYRWDYATSQFMSEKTPVLTSHFAGIGSRQLNADGKQAIRDVYKNTTEQINTKNYEIDTPGADIYIMKTENMPNGFSVLVKEGQIIETIPGAKTLLGKSIAEAEQIATKKGGSFTRTGERKQEAPANKTQVVNTNKATDTIKIITQDDNTQIDTSVTDIYIGRTSKARFHFGNPFTSANTKLAKGNDLIGFTPSNEQSVNLFQEWLEGAFPSLEPERRLWIIQQIELQNLEGKNLHCFAHGGKCHGGVLKSFDTNLWRNDGNKPIVVETGGRIDYRYPGTLKTKFGDQFNTKKLLEIKKVFDEGGTNDSYEERHDLIESLDEYSMSDKQYEYAKKNQGILDDLNRQLFTENEEGTVHYPYDNFVELIDELLVENQIIIDRNQLDMFDNEVDHMMPDNHTEELLASEDPALQDFIVEHFAKIFPGLKIFTSKKAFQEFIENLGGDMSNFQLNAIGGAFANGIYIDPANAVQSSFIHENAHIYWNLLPANDPTKIKLVEMFGTVEDAIIEIGKAGYRYAESQMEYQNSSTWKKFSILIKDFWKKLANMFSGAKKTDPVYDMVRNIWANKNGVFDRATQNKTIDHMIQHDEVTFDEANHSYVSIDGSVQFTSATQIVGNLQVSKFNATEAASNQASTESKERLKAGGGSYGFEEKQDRIKEIKDEWLADAKRGTDLHALIESHRTGEAIHPDTVGHFADPKVMTDFLDAIDKHFTDRGIDPGSEVYEEVLADFESYIAGIKDLSFKENGKLHVTDFKFSRKSKYNDDGTLADSYTQAHEGRRFKKPISAALESEQNKHKLQLNVYSELIRRATGASPWALSITPIHYETNEQGKITKIEFEPVIPVTTVTTATHKLFDMNKRVVEKTLEGMDTSTERRGYIDKTALKLENDAIIRLTSFLDDDQSLSDLATDPLLADSIYQQSGMNVRNILRVNFDFTESELANKKLITLLHHWKTGKPLPDTVGSDYNEPFPSTTGFEAKYEGHATADMKAKFQKDRAKALEIYEEIGSLSNLEVLSNTELFNYYTKLRGMDEYTAGPLLYYIEQTLVREILVKEVGKENAKGFNGYKRATVLLNEISQSEDINKEDKISWFAKMFLNDRSIGHNHRRIQYFVSKIREARNKADSKNMDITQEIGKFFRKGIVMSKLVHNVKGTLYFKKQADADWTENEEKFIKYIYSLYGNYHNYHRHQDSIGGDIPLIPVPTHMQSNWSMMWNFGRFGMKGSQYHKYFKPSVFDNEIIIWNGEEMTLENAKRSFTIGVDSLADFKKVYKDAEKIYERKPENVKLKKTSLPIANDPRGKYNKFDVNYESKMFKYVLAANLNSVVDKFYMEPLVPLWKATESNYLTRGENFKNIADFVDRFGQVQIFGTSSDDRSKVDKVFSFFMKMVAMKSLYLNWFAQLLNLSIGQIQNYVRGTRSDATGLAQVLIPTAFFSGIFRLSTNPVKVVNLLRRYQVVDVTNEHALDDLERASKAINAFSMIFTQIVEHINHGIIFAGNMTPEQWAAHNIKGKVKSGKQGVFNEQDRKVIENEVRTAHGDYGSKNKRFINYTSYLRPLMQFRNWMPAYFQSRFGAAYIDENGVKQHGFYRVFTQHLYIKFVYNRLPKSYRQKLYDKYKIDGTDLSFKGVSDEQLVGSIELIIRDAKAGKVKFTDLSVSDQRAFGHAVRSLSILMGTLVYLSYGGDEDDKKKTSLMNLFFVRLSGDALMFGNVQFLIESILPMLEWLKSAIITGTYLTKYLALMAGEKFDSKELKELGEGALYKKNSDYGKKDEPKFFNSLIRTMPYGSGIYMTKKAIYEKQNPSGKKDSLGSQSLDSGSLKPQKLK